MNDRLREQVQGFVQQLLKEEKPSLRKAQTFLEIENLVVEVRDEIARAPRQVGTGLHSQVRELAEYGRA